MTLPNLDPSRAPDVLFDDICDYVAQAEKHIDAREAVDLIGLDKAIEGLCAGIMALPVGDAKTYNGKLTELMEAIETMQTKMMKLQDEIGTTIKSLNTQKRAALAYINAPKGTS